MRKQSVTKAAAYRPLAIASGSRPYAQAQAGSGVPYAQHRPPHPMQIRLYSKGIIARITLKWMAKQMT
jgi:hypothetical protein